MGHIAAKDIYRKLGKKIDGLTVRVPWNETLYEVGSSRVDLQACKLEYSIVSPK